MRPILGELLGAAVLAALPAGAQSSEKLDFLSDHTDFQRIRRMLPDWANAQARALLDARTRKVEGFSSAQEVAAQKQRLRERMIRSLGGFPERTPLNARITGTLERDDFRIEKIVFESQPGFYVTANLYLPTRGQPPYPAILFPLGHEEGAKANPVWQRILASFAKKGFVALAWDTLGQGERIQLYDVDFKASKVVRSTTEHTVLGAQCLLVGDSLARYTVWDGIRALDYLLSRKEVDASRVGCTGNSGGGTHTAYLSALEDRIHVAAPSCYLTGWKQLLATIGPQDAEQCIPPWLADGLDHADFVHAFAPKPYLILSAIRDFFSITGAREVYREARHVYGLLGAAEKLKMVEADDGHGYTKPRRLASYAWFTRWLKGAEDGEEPEVPIATEEELFATPAGQVAVSLGGETVHTLNLKRARQLRRSSAPRPDEVRRLIGFEAQKEPVRVRPFGRIQRNGYHIEKLLYESEPGISVPALLFLPDAPGRKPAAIYVHGRGKAAGSGELEQLARSGSVVLSIDARGLGETRHLSDDNGSDWPRYFGDYESAMTLLLCGKTLAGGRALDIVRGVDLLAARDDVDAASITGLGIEAGAIPLAHAALLDSRIRRLSLERMLVSYMAVVTHKINRGIFEDVIPGVLKSYDLPDLAAALAPRQVRLVDPVDPLGLRVAIDEARKTYAAANVEVVERQPHVLSAEPR
jgi:cephalosporin-C deacetylase-like acetyl esterase